MPLTRPLRIAAIPLAVLTVLVLAPTALAGTISLSRPCYVAPALGKGATIEVTGSGFTPDEEVFAQIPAPDGLLAFGEATVGPDGSLAATLTDVSPASINPVAEKEKMQIEGVLSGAILAEAPFALTNLAVRTKPAVARPGKRVTFEFSGFRPGKPVYGHYLRHGKVVLTHKFGKAKGACGLLRAKSRIFPGRSHHSASYAVQFDDAKRYSKKRTPRIDTKVTIQRF